SWKTSYRLVLSNKKDGKPMLQGWAVVDNSSEEDWKDVRMALVSGRPISFQMDLYQPLYVPRPVVEPELFASLRPTTYSGAMERLSERAAKTMTQPAPMTKPSDRADDKSAAGKGFRGGFGYARKLPNKSEDARDSDAVEALMIKAIDPL